MPTTTPRPGFGPTDARRWGGADDVRRGVLAGLALLALLMPPAPTGVQGHGRGSPGAAEVLLPPTPHAAARVPDFGATEVSPDTRELVHWVARTGDHGQQAFVVVDKKAAQLQVFDAAVRLQVATPVLLGLAPGDDTVPGIGSRPMAQVRPEERTTPAGRFVGVAGRNSTGEDVVWVDHAAAVSLHRVRTTQPWERRLQRLASVSLADKRISYGCINVPAGFYDTHIRPLFAGRRAVIYVLPEIKTLQQVFGIQAQNALP